jgi:hypothetical protein
MVRLTSVVPALGLAPLLAACGSDPDLTPYTVDTRVDGAATGALVAHQAPGGWAAATENTAGVFTFPPAGEDVVFAVACPPSDRDGRIGVDVAIEYGTLLDSEHALARPCWSFVPDERFDATVKVVPAEASLSIASWTLPSVGGDGVGELPVTVGSFDVLSFTPSRVLIERGVSFPRSETLVMDVESRGTDRQLLDLAPPPLAEGEVLSTEYAFRTAGGTQGMTLFPATDVRIVPDALTIAGDRHRLVVSAERDQSRRWALASSPLTTDLVRAMDLPHGFGNVTASADGGLAVRWSARPADGASGLQVSLGQNAGGPVRWTASYDDAWLTRHDQDVDGSWTPPDLSRVAGWRPAWNLDPVFADLTSWSLSTLEATVDTDVLRASWGNEWGGWLGAPDGAAARQRLSPAPRRTSP